MKSKEVDPRIRALTSEVTDGKSARYIEEMINTALGFGRDHATIAEVKLMSRALREMRVAARVFAKYNRVRKVAVFGSARTKPEQEEFKQAVAFGKKLSSRGIC
jgi:cytosine/adenosine deaminase-related metal-dependent hydrolase